MSTATPGTVLSVGADDTVTSLSSTLPIVLLFGSSVVSSRFRMTLGDRGALDGLRQLRRDPWSPRALALAVTIH